MSRFIIDTEDFTLTPPDGASVSWFSDQGFALLSHAWLKASWQRRYSYQFHWLGRPIIQLPADLLMMQDLIYRLRPTTIIETGLAHGGTAVFYASMMLLAHHGHPRPPARPRVIAVDVEIRPHNRAALEEHALREHITLIEGDSAATETRERVRALVTSEEVVLVALDSCHQREHVFSELRLYAPLVSPGSALVVMDGVMPDLADLPAGDPAWRRDHPRAALEAFLATREGSEFTIDRTYDRYAITHSPGGILIRGRERSSGERALCRSAGGAEEAAPPKGRSDSASCECIVAPLGRTPGLNRCVSEAALVSVGLFVRNGQEHLAEAIRTLLDQTFRAFTLTVFDNASTDETPRIVERFAAIDPRVRRVRQERDLGAVANCAAALEHADTPFFCWAAADDAREPRFLETLLTMLQDHPEAGVACCGARDVGGDDGGAGWRESPVLRTSVAGTAADRLVMYLRDGACLPFYGLYRTSAAKAQLPLLREYAEPADPPMFRIDMLFLASLLKEHGIVVTDEPLLRYRRGGHSGRIERYETPRRYVHDLRRFAKGLRRATSGVRGSALDRIRVRLSTWQFLMRFLLSRSMRRMHWHYLQRVAPSLSILHGIWLLATDPAFRRLQRRVRRLPRGTRVVVFPAGKHTRHCLSALRRALAPHATVVALCDEDPAMTGEHRRIPLVSPAELGRLQVDLIVVSSDTWEERLMRRAAEIAPAITRWCLYDVALEDVDAASPPDFSRRSTSARNCSIAPMAS